MLRDSLGKGGHFGLSRHDLCHQTLFFQRTIGYFANRRDHHVALQCTIERFRNSELCGQIEKHAYLWSVRECYNLDLTFEKLCDEGVHHAGIGNGAVLVNVDRSYCRALRFERRYERRIRYAVELNTDASAVQVLALQRLDHALCCWSLRNHINSNSELAQCSHWFRSSDHDRSFVEG